ncbi:MAG: Thioredoxin [Verrucomicrobiota bacterium]|jgi:thiol-disulfide isomerase/thioredoxin
MKILFASISLLAASLALHAQDAAPKPAPAPAAAAEKLVFGSPAPEIKFGQFYKGEAITSLAADQNYILECWATWCGPCKAAFPHVSAIAKALDGKATVIGVNIWERKNPTQVQEFVKEQGGKMSYSVAADTADGWIANNWLKPAGQRSIPFAVVVVKGKIAWFGHPNDLDGEVALSLIEGKITGDEIKKRSDIVAALRRDRFSEAEALIADLSKASPDVVKILNLSKQSAMLAFKKSVKANSGEAAKLLVAMTDCNDFISAGEYLVKQGKISPEDFVMIDAVAAEFYNKFGVGLAPEKVYCSVFRAKLLASQSKFEEAATFLEKVKPELDPEAASFIDGEIKRLRAKSGAAH